MGMRVTNIWSEVERWEVEAKCRWKGRECGTPRMAGTNKSKEVIE